jgi:hypothetical protein
MSKYRSQLPQLQNRLFTSDGGLETTLVFHEGIDLPHFAAFDLLKDDAGREVLRDYYVRYIELARANRMGIVLESPTWRASRDWGARLGYDGTALAEANRKAVRPPTRAACGPRDRAHADRRERQPRAARRRLQSNHPHDRLRGRGLPRRADRDLRPDRCGHDRRLHDQLCRGGDRHRGRGARAGPAGRDPVELGTQYPGLRSVLPGLAVIGGCCGTDHRHVGAMCAALG